MRTVPSARRSESDRIIQCTRYSDADAGRRGDGESGPRCDVARVHRQAGEAEEGQRRRDGAKRDDAEEPIGAVRVRVAVVAVPSMIDIVPDVVAADVVAPFEIVGPGEAGDREHELASQDGAAENGADRVEDKHGGETRISRKRSEDRRSQRGIRRHDANLSLNAQVVAGKRITPERAAS